MNSCVNYRDIINTRKREKGKDNKREREREREIESERARGREREREGERLGDIYTERDRGRGSETERQREIKMRKINPHDKVMMYKRKNHCIIVLITIPKTLYSNTTRTD